MYEKPSIKSALPYHDLNLIHKKIRPTATLETQTHTQWFLPVSCNTAIVFLQVEICQSQPNTEPLVTYELVAAL